MKNKGFTLVELLSVIVIIGILASLAAIGLSKYRQTVNEKELVNLHSTIEAAYDKYRSDLIISGGNHQEEFTIGKSNTKIFKKYFSEFSYSGNRLTQEELKGSTFSIKVKGSLIKNENYIKDNKGASENNENLYQAYLKDGICIPESSASTQEGSETSINNKCKLDDGEPIASQEEILCIKLYRGTEVLIDDYDQDKSMQPLCVYFGNPDNPENTGVEEETPDE